MTHILREWYQSTHLTLAKKAHVHVSEDRIFQRLESEHRRYVPTDLFFHRNSWIAEVEEVKVERSGNQMLQYWVQTAGEGGDGELEKGHQSFCKFFFTNGRCDGA